MKRLTERFTHKAIAGVCLKALDLKGNTADNSLVLERLAAFEDFVEEMGFEDLEELKKHFEIWNLEDDELFIKDTDKWKLWGYRFAKNRFRFEQQEKQILENRWKNLKDWFYKHYELNVKAKYKDADTIKYILDKMEKLEEGGE